MLHGSCLDRSVFVALVVVDQRLAEAARAQGCPACSAALHRRDYLRKPRGGLLAAAGEEFRRRFGLCCSREGCRRSVLPPSVRFLGQRVYLEAVILLACLHALIGEVPGGAPVAAVPKKTVRRWLSWWTSTFLSSPTWLWIRGRLMPPVDETQVPRSFIERVAQGLGDAPDVGQVLTIAAQWLAPLTTRSLSDPSRFLLVN